MIYLLKGHSDECPFFYSDPAHLIPFQVISFKLAKALYQRRQTMK
jgi:hypothetical protein